MNRLQQLLQKGTVVDVRTPHEYLQEHYPGAINIPLDDIPKRFSELGNKNSPVVAYCRSGNRSAIAVGILKQMGFTEVYNGGALADLLFQTHAS